MSRSHLLGCGWFWAWALVGAIASLGLLSLGVLALLPAAGLAAVLLRRGPSETHAYGLLTGAGFFLLVVAYLQRQGPGTTCWKRATASGCDQHLDPRPWLVAGVILVLAGVIAQARSSRGR
jgi:hypothetical protein